MMIGGLNRKYSPTTNCELAHLLILFYRYPLTLPSPPLSPLTTLTSPPIPPLSLLSSLTSLPPLFFSTLRW